jgi:hypothetical protein
MNFHKESAHLQTGNLVKTKIKTNTGLFVSILCCFFYSGFSQSAPNFGAVSDFVLFTVNGAIGNTGTTTITGDIGSNVGAISGFAAPSVVNGTIYAADAVTNSASADLLAAYTQLNNTTATNTSHTASFGNGETLTAGVYVLSNAGTIDGTLILDAQGNTNALFIFKTGGALSSGAEAKVILINGAKAKHVFWVAEGAIALATMTSMNGVLIANNGAVSLAAGCSLIGRMYSTTGAIAVDASSVVIVENSNGLVISSNQTICPGTQPDNLILSGNTGSIVKWQRATDANFTLPIDISVTAVVLTGEIIGALSETTYFRAVEVTGDGLYIFSDYVSITIYIGQHPDFGTAADFIFFTINGAVGNTGTSNITGNIGTNLGVISGFESPTIVNGNIHNANATTSQAATDLIIAYNQLHALTPTNTSHPAAFGNGEIVTPGIYEQTTAVTIAGNLTLDAEGDHNAMFVFRVEGALSTAVGTTIILTNGASAENIFWIAEGAIGMGATTTMYGTLLSNNGAISMGAGDILYGRMYSNSGAIAAYGNAATIIGDGIMGTVSENQTFCFGNSPTDLSLSGYTGNILKWQSASNASFDDSEDIACTSNILTATIIGALNVTTYFRAVISKGLCGTVISNPIAINIIPQTIGGTLSPNQIICRATIPTNLILAGNIGNVIKWQSAADATFTVEVQDINSTANSYTGEAIGMLTATRYFRAVVQSEGCTIINSASVEIFVPPTSTFTNGAWDEIPNEKTAVIINADLLLTANLHVCSCQIINAAIVTVPTGKALIVERDLSIEATANLIIENSGSLVQVEDSGTTIGNITVNRDSEPMKLYDYSYWSAPVKDWRLNQLSPNTLSDKYFDWNPLTYNWNTINGGIETMEPGKGYIVRAPQDWTTANETSGVYQGNFSGNPNTGIVPVVIQKGIGTLNLIGNPYPSAINIDLFLTNTENEGILSGTIYLWTHNIAISNTIPGNEIYNYTSDDYAKYNLTGGVKTASASITGGIAPDGIIASGQGFFIEANATLTSGSYVANFKNSMRIIDKNNQFYRATSVIQPIEALQKNRLWLNMSNEAGAYSETLLGYVSGATDGFDNLYDGKTFFTGNVLSLYSIVGADTYSIQGKAIPFNIDAVIPLGYSTTIDGNFTISIDKVDGLFQNQNVYLVDHFNNTIQNLKLVDYNFTTTAGTYNNRFELRFEANALSTVNPTFDKNNVMVYQHDGTLIINTGNILMDDVKIFDISGRLLLQKDQINAFETKIPMARINEVLIVVVTSQNHETVTKKIVN